MARFLWDATDTNNEGGNDDTPLSIGTIVAAFHGMPCVQGAGYGTDGTCNEALQAMAPLCKPFAEFLPGVLPLFAMNGTRDAYNVADLDAIFAGDQSAERALNCVAGATDF